MPKTKESVSAYNKAYRLRNRERLIARERARDRSEYNKKLRQETAAFRAANPRPEPIGRKESERRSRAKRIDKIAVYNREYREANHDRLLASEKTRRETNHDEINRRRREEYARNRDAYADRARLRRAADPELFREYKRRYYTTERGRLINRASAHRRRLQKIGSSATIEQIEVILGAARCYLCGKAFTKSNPATIEHVLALSSGGANDSSNLAAAHLSCNSRKWKSQFNPHTGQGILL